MDNVLAQAISSFPVSPTICIPASALQAILDGLQELKDEVSLLQATVAAQDEKIAALGLTQDTQADNQLIQLQLINQLREAGKQGPGKTETSRAEKIEKFLASRPDHKAAFETLKGHLQVDNVRLNEAIKVLMATSERSYSIQKERTGDKRKRILVMLPR